jgi:hypothetical protein
MEGSCSTGQSPQWAVVPVEEEKEEEEEECPLIVLQAAIWNPFKNNNQERTFFTLLRCLE